MLFCHFGGGNIGGLFEVLDEHVFVQGGELWVRTKGTRLRFQAVKMAAGLSLGKSEELSRSGQDDPGTPPWRGVWATSSWEET